MSVHDNEEEGVEKGDCSFVVHGLTREEFSEMTLEKIKELWSILQRMEK